MRKIKFRVYHPDSGIKYFMLNQIDNGCVLFDDGDRRPLSDCEIAQFIGLFDCNGKEIYEGDICKKDCGSYGLATAIIEYDPRWMKFYFKQTMGWEWAFDMPDGPNWSPEEVEVIGNIYENPELLEVKCEK